jgi:hypothetical protein
MFPKKKRLTTYLRSNKKQTEKVIIKIYGCNKAYCGHVQSTHRGAQVENPGEGVAQIFAWGGQGFPNKTTWRVILGFIAFLLTSFFENLLGGSYVVPPSPLTPVCIYESTIPSRRQ